MSESVRARFRRLEPLLDRALELEGEEREAFIAECADSQPDLVAHLRRALAADEAALPGLGSLAAEAVRRDSTERHNLRAGPWQLVERLGRGGMGTVYLAERADGAFDKRVAIKLLRGQDDLRFKEHLERERQVLARLDHPSIARLVDGGVLPDGQPYLVMELAPGDELHTWLQAQSPSLERRLQVFLGICAAVGYAHSHLIVHRDLKPTNIRVDARDQPRLLDFGIAKLLDSEASRGDTRHLALTPEYAAPEQLQGGTVTTRTDIYALGALLHLLLTGRSPHPRFDGDWASLVAAVCELPRAAPSLAVAGAEASPLALPARRLRGDLDAIVLRALALEPAQRYGSAEALAEDVRRHLDGRAVHARPQRWTYLFARWFQRNWVPASLGLAAFVLLAGAALLLAWQSRIVASERDAAQREARRSEVVRDYLLLMFREAAEEAPEVQELRARELLERSASRVEAEFAGDPAARQQVLATLGELFVALHDYAGAEPMLRRFIALDDGSAGRAATARVLTDLGTVALRRGNPQEACDHASGALRMLEEGSADRRALAADALMVRGQCLRLTGDMEGSLAAYRQALERHHAVLGARNRRTASAENNLALGLLHAGRYPEAEQHFTSALEILETLGEVESDAAASMLNNLAALSLFRGELHAAEAHFARAIAVREAIGAESAAMAGLLSNYGRVLTLQHRLDQAGAALRRGEELSVRFTGEDSVDTALVRLAVVDHALAAGDAQRAATLLASARAVIDARLGVQHPYAARAAQAAGEVAAAQGNRVAARAGFDRAVTVLEGGGSPLARYLAAALCARAEFALATDARAAAATDAERCLALRRDLAGPTSWETAHAQALLDAAHGSSDRSAIAKVAAVLGERHPKVLALNRMLP